MHGIHLWDILEGIKIKILGINNFSEKCKVILSLKGK